MWPMFAFGFGGIFVITQMHGLNWSRWRDATCVLDAYFAWATVYTFWYHPMLVALGLIRLIRPATASARTPSAPSGERRHA